MLIKDTTAEIRPLEPFVAWKDRDLETSRKADVDRAAILDPLEAKVRAVSAWLALMLILSIADVTVTVETGVPTKLLLALGQPWDLVPFRSVAHFAVVVGAGLVVATKKTWPAALALFGTLASLIVDSAFAYACVRAIVKYMDANEGIVDRPPAGWTQQSGSAVFSRTVMRLGACGILGVFAAAVSLILLVFLFSLTTLLSARAEAYRQALRETETEESKRKRRRRRAR